MIIYQTKILQEAAMEPTQLDIERILHIRRRQETVEDNYRLKRLEAGELGENILLNYLENYGEEDWIVIQNIWLNNGGPFEGDLILLTNCACYLFEVKNYSSHLIYENGVTKINNQIISGNPINQARRNTINLQDICKMYSDKVEVYGALILIGEDNYAEIKSEISDIDIIQRNQIKYYIQKIAEKEKIYNKQPINKKRLLNHLEKFEMDRYYKPEQIEKDVIEGLRKGINCLNCNSFNIDIRRKRVRCLCGFSEEREMAIFRTICEYGVLSFNENLQTGALTDFFGNQISKTSIHNVLKKYFEEVRSGRYTYFINKNLPSYKLLRKTKSQSMVYMELTYQEYEKIQTV